MNDFYTERWIKVRNIEGASQRIQEDTMRFASIMKGLGVYMVDSVMTLISFLPVLTALSIKLKVLLRVVLTKFLLSSLGSFLYLLQFSSVLLVKVLTVDLYVLLIKRFLSAICILFFADLLLATEGA